MRTRTGGFPLGFRRGGGQWQKDLGTLIGWARSVDVEVIDLGRDGDQTARQVVAAGLRVGSVDLIEWQGMIAADKAVRQAAVAKNAAYIQDCGTFNYFLVMLPKDPSLPRAENFGYMVESFGELVPVLEANGARLVIEGWPGPGALCCTPEGYRALFAALPSKAMGINYDPSHLIRQGIDPIRFLGEFASRVYHIHGKDTELLPENLYEYGHEQSPTFGKPFSYGSMSWRYTIPGHGVMRWGAAFQMLKDAGYAGCASIEMEDANFNGSEEGEKLGIVQGTHFLAGC